MAGLDQPRSTPRFLPDVPFPATFTVAGALTPVSIRDLSVTGAQIELGHSIRPGTKGLLNIELVEVQAVVIWSQLAAPGVYRSGLGIHGQIDVVAATIRDLLGRGLVKKQGDETLRKREEALRQRDETAARIVNPAAKPAGPSEEQLRLVRKARERMLMHPEEAVRWYNRARATATEDHLRIAGSGRPNREDVLAVWEYLERSIDLRLVVQALS